TENGEQWQYFERFALVLDAGTVESVRLGGPLTQGRAFATVSASGSTPTTKCFPATDHTVAGEVRACWVTHHGAPLLGTPLLQVISEGNGDGTGRRYAVQWFEGDRLEFHPELTGTGYSVELGLLGKQALIAQGWLS
ncbi:MAG: spore peptidoglycan hydrolase, partial [Chloroflexi bacterium]|nr:spore peptidoglycan hydrolase [Chloroflexota bacterium]